MAVHPVMSQTYYKVAYYFPQDAHPASASREDQGRAEGTKAGEWTVSDEPKFGKGRDVMIGGVLSKAAEHDALEAACRARQLAGDRAYHNARGAIGREAIDAGRYRGECQGAELVSGGEVDGAAIARCQQLFLARGPAAPDRTDGVNDMLHRQPIAARDFRRSGFAATKGPAFGDEIRPGGAMDGAVDPAATKETTVGGIDDGIEP